MNIRNFHLRDYADVLEIWKNTGLDGDESANLDSLAKQLSWDSELVLVAEEKEKVVGVIMGTIDGNRAYFYRLAVAPLFQKKGIGQLLVVELERRFREKGATEIIIMVSQKNKESIPFYSSLGYEINQLVTLSKSIV